MSTTQKAFRWLEGKIIYSVGFGVVMMLATGAGLFFFYSKRPDPVVRVAYGTGGALRKYFLDQLAIHGKKHHLDIRVLPTAGTGATMDMIGDGSADVGLIAGAVRDQRERHIVEISPLYMEPLQLLVKEPLYEAVMKDFGQLRGKSIAMDAENSATSLLATELLRFMGLDHRGDKPQYERVQVQQSTVLSQPPSSLPDAIFQIAGMPSPVIQDLIVDRGYRLVPLPFGSAFNLGKFQEAVVPDEADAAMALDKAFVEEFVMPAYAYSVLPAVPPTDTRTVATRLLLVGRMDLPDHVVRNLLEEILSPEISELARPPLRLSLLDSDFQYERHPGTDRYLASLRPVNVEGAFDTYGRLVEVWGFIAAAYFAAAKGLKHWRERKVVLTEKSVGDFLTLVLDVESEALPSCTAEQRHALDQRLSDIKRRAIELQGEDRLEDAETLQSLLVAIADARNRVWGTAS